MVCEGIKPLYVPTLNLKTLFDLHNTPQVLNIDFTAGEGTTLSCSTVPLRVSTRRGLVSISA